MMEMKGALIVCDRCNLAAFTKLGDYDSIETPGTWHKVRFGTCLKDFNLCPECYEQFEFAKNAFFNEETRTQRGIIAWREKDE